MTKPGNVYIDAFFTDGIEACPEGKRPVVHLGAWGTGYIEWEYADCKTKEHLPQLTAISPKELPAPYFCIRQEP